MIPKIINYCWFGGNPLPDSVLKCIESWKRFCPDYEIKQWNENNYDYKKQAYTLEAYEAKREKNRAAAQKRWNNPDDMRSHTDAMQTDGDNVNANVNVNGNGNANGNVNDIDMSVLSGSDAPSVAEVLEVASNHDIELTEAEAKEFITYYFLDRKGELNGEPIRDWRKLLKSWNDHTLVVTDSILGPDHEGYEAFLKLPDDLQERIVDEQTRFGGRNITRATAMAITACRKAV